MSEEQERRLKPTLQAEARATKTEDGAEEQKGEVGKRDEHWTAWFSGPIIFVILTMIAVGVYMAYTIPVAVFPSTDFPRIVVGIDNGVAPISQMQVMVTRPVEEAM